MRLLPPSGVLKATVFFCVLKTDLPVMETWKVCNWDQIVLKNGISFKFKITIIF